MGLNRKGLILFLLLLISGPVFSDIAPTPHNLSVTGPGKFKAASETRICVFCHVPHDAEPAKPLWNHNASLQSFTPYNQSVSLTLKSNPGQPDGASKLCLGCHDGTVAVGSTISMGSISGLSGKISGSSLIGTNLSTSHPISFVYDATLAAKDGELVSPATLTGSVKVDQNSRLQCTSCHDPHDNKNGKFLVLPNVGGKLCSTCHNKTGWSTSIHKTSPAMGGGECNNCHKPHGANAVPLLKNNNSGNICYSCHGSAGPGPVDIQSLFSGSSLNTGAGVAGSYSTVNTHHDVSGSDQSYSGSKMSCSSCHNPHAAKPKSNSGGAIETLVDPFNRTAVWTGAGATDYRGSIINFCLKCHSGSYPPSVFNPNQTIASSSPMINIGTTYQTDRHGAGSARPTSKNTSPAVQAMACTACHNPHGSHYSDQSWNGNVYHFNDTVDGTAYADNGAEAGAPLNWPYVAPSSSTGIMKNVRIDPNKINDTGEPNNLYNLCGACHSKTSGPAGASHTQSFSGCTTCHRHGNKIGSGGL